MMGKGIGGHHASVASSDEWITPLSVLDALGRFDLDPCASDPQPWPTASVMWPARGLDRPWLGRVWLNPPYNRYGIGDWMGRLAEHGDGIAIVFARTETDWFFEHVWERADALRFLRGRVRFCRADGTQPPGTSGAPSVLVAYGEANVECLRTCGIPGQWVRLREDSP